MAEPNSTTAITASISSGDREYLENHTLYAGVAVCVIGLILNISAIKAIYHSRQKRKRMRPHTRFLLNIIISDIWISLSCVAYFTVCLYEKSLLTNSDKQEDEISLMNRFDCITSIINIFRMMSPIGNLFGQALMSLDHFIAISCPLKHTRLLSRCTVEMLITSAWIMAIIFGFAFQASTYTSVILAVTNISNVDFETLCEKGAEVKDLTRAHSKINTTVILLTVIGLVFLTIFAMYCYIAWVALKAIKTKWYFQRYSCTSSKNSRSAQKRRKQVKGIGTTILLLASFILLWAPVEVYYILFLNKNLVIPSKPDEKIGNILSVLVCCTALVDVGIYFMRSKEGTAVMKRYRQQRLADWRGANLMQRQLIKSTSPVAI